MNTEHTKGPWHAAGQAVYSDRVYIAQCFDDGSKELPEYAGAIGNERVPDNGREAQANARLIAAAPELLAALEACLESGQLTPLTPNVIRMTRAAINKATGQ